MKPRNIAQNELVELALKTIGDNLPDKINLSDLS